MYDVSTHSSTRVLSSLILLACVCASPARSAASPDEALDGQHPAGELRLCELRLYTEPEAFACREYETVNGSQIVLFKGGRHPRAVVDRRGVRQTVSASAGLAVEASGTPPPGVSPKAEHLGTGVCVDDERLLPCEAYLYAPARDFTKSIFLVFYDPDGGGPLRVEATPAGTNQDALTAELAFQMGRALLKSGCCHAQAEAYLAYAYERFPGEPDYGSAYREALSATASARRRAHAADAGSPAGVVGQASSSADDRY